MAWALWFTGLPGSGKTALSKRTMNLLRRSEIRVKVLELDEIRRFITPHPAYTEEERDIVYASLAYMAKLLTECDINVIIDATANRRRYRDLARSVIPDFAEVFVRCPLELCMERERKRIVKFSPKGIYDKSAQPSATVPGVNVPYEEPLSPEIIIDSDRIDAFEGAEVVVKKLKEMFK